MSDDVSDLKRQIAELERRVQALERANQQLHNDYERDIGRLLEHKDTIRALLPGLLREEQRARTRPENRAAKASRKNQSALRPAQTGAQPRR